MKQYLTKSEHIFRTVASGIHKESSDKTLYTHFKISYLANYLAYIFVK